MKFNDFLRKAAEDCVNRTPVFIDKPEEGTEEPFSTQIQAPDGAFAGFKRPCRGCGTHYRTLGEDGHCRHCEKLMDEREKAKADPFRGFREED